MVPTAKFRTTFFDQFFTSLRKDSVTNYAWIWMLFSPSLRGQDVLYNALFVVPSVGGSDILVLKLISVLVFILFASQNFYFI